MSLDPEMVFWVNLGVDLYVCLCGALSVIKEIPRLQIRRPSGRPTQANAKKEGRRKYQDYRDLYL